MRSTTFSRTSSTLRRPSRPTSIGFSARRSRTCATCASTWRPLTETGASRSVDDPFCPFFLLQRPLLTSSSTAVFRIWKLGWRPRLLSRQSVRLSLLSPHYRSASLTPASQLGRTPPQPLSSPTGHPTSVSRRSSTFRRLSVVLRFSRSSCFVPRSWSAVDLHAPLLFTCCLSFRPRSFFCTRRRLLCF